MQNLAWWKAWQTMEPRGEARGDWHAALLSLPNLKDGRLIDALRMLWDCWHPPDPAEKRRRKTEMKRRAAEKARAFGRKIKHERETQSRGQKHRHAEREGGPRR